jgi:hypothetical protein
MTCAIHNVKGLYYNDGKELVLGLLLYLTTWQGALFVLWQKTFRLHTLIRYALSGISSPKTSV